MNNNFRLYVNDQWPEPAINPSGALLMGLGTSTTQPESSAADKNWMSFYLKSTATSGTSRGMYLRLYLPSNAGGEALRVFTTVSSNTPADTVNGAHISLNFGSSAGNVTGEGQAIRGTLHLGTRSMTGTLAAIKAELWSDGTASSVGGVMSFLRFTNGGNATGRAAIDTSGYLFHIDGLTAAQNKLFVTGTTAAVNSSASLRIRIGATNYFIPLMAAQQTS